MVLALSDTGAVVAAAAEARGTENVFLTFEKREETKAYDDWSCSSSSENGLKDVKLMTSSNLLLLRDLEDAARPDGGSGANI